MICTNFALISGAMILHTKSTFSSDTYQIALKYTPIMNSVHVDLVEVPFASCSVECQLKTFRIVLRQIALVNWPL